MLARVTVCTERTGGGQCTGDCKSYLPSAACFNPAESGEPSSSSVPNPPTGDYRAGLDGGFTIEAWLKASPYPDTASTDSMRVIASHMVRKLAMDGSARARASSSRRSAPSAGEPSPKCARRDGICASER